MAKRKIVLLLGLALPLAACSVGPEYRPASTTELGVPDEFSVVADQRAQEDLARWWGKFDDPMLAELVEMGRKGNLDVGQAMARLRQARESLVQARGALLPTVGVSGSVSHSESLRGGTTTTTLPDGTVTSYSQGGSTSYSLGGDASYTIDLFGGNASNARAARAAYEASGYTYAATMISIEAEIARNYVLARLYQAQLAHAKASLAIQDDNLQIAGWRVQAGLVSSLDVEQARSQRAQTAASIPGIEANYNAAVSRLAVLTGQSPGALKARMAETRPIPHGPESVAVGIPADTLRQRPDVLSAERNLAAATARIGVSKAQLYPSLSIGGSIDTGADSIGSLGDLITGRLFANIAQTLFDGGRRQSQVRASEAAAEGAFLAYKQTVLTSLEDIENAIFALDAAQRREREYTIALDAATNQALLARDQYRSGLTDFTTLNTAESALLSARNGLAQAQADKANALIQLYTALGGGWNSTSAPEATSSTTGSTADGN
ncbi:MAG: efflux transporter outer membrane subunit [Pseudomonadota bacterium]